ncbi:MlaD family protein [Patulibacter brassicae]|uniref:MlaD family protein n=1 Tax=Patulibacter brassicae TaxID=1705717 RepID=A0ABU4VNC1_9ACTN|nr:MlaD family protein [Patulibacter brassicae]MDX8153323.1 MlaD family protein [Patulibacter brassicae]
MTIEGRHARRTRNVRTLAVAGLAIVVAGLVYLLAFSGGSDYKLHVRFQNAGQLVQGGLVQVGGVKVGQIDRISISDDGQADLELGITDEDFVPLNEGTRAQIRAVGQATLTNRYVALTPGPDNRPALRDGATLAATDTRGIVDLDAILSSLDGPFREDLRALIQRSSEVFAGSGAPSFNRMLAKIDPAFASLDGLLGDLRTDQDAIDRLVRSGATAAGAVADRRASLVTAVGRTERTFRAVADQQQALSGVLQRAPAVLRQAGGTLRRAGSTAQALRPALRAVPEPQADLRVLLRRLPKVLRRTDPVGAQLERILGPLRTAVNGLPQLERPTVDGAKAISDGLDEAMPMLEGLRFYGSDFILGIVNGLVSIGTGGYHQHGHYLKIEFVQSPQTLLGGALGGLIPALAKITDGVIPGVINLATHQNRRCPGGNAPPAPDGSNPWYPKEGICDPTTSMSRLVNSPPALCRTYSRCDGDDRSLKPDPDGRNPQRPTPPAGASR